MQDDFDTQIQCEEVYTDEFYGKVEQKQPIRLRFVAVELSTGYCAGDNEIISRQVYDTTVGTLSKARDEMIKVARKEHMEDRKDMGENYHSAYDCIHKWEFKTPGFTGYYHYEDGLTFLFPSYSPVYKPVVEGRISDQELHKQLLSLFDFWQEQHDDLRWSKRETA